MKLPTELLTKNGHRVINLSYVPLNSCGDKVTFPIKGTLVLREKPRKLKYEIWREDGRNNVFKPSEFDLVLPI